MRPVSFVVVDSVRGRIRDAERSLSGSIVGSCWIGCGAVFQWLRDVSVERMRLPRAWIVERPRKTERELREWRRAVTDRPGGIGRTVASVVRFHNFFRGRVRLTGFRHRDDHPTAVLAAAAGLQRSGSKKQLK
jgi:hypothetical protein